MNIVTTVPKTDRSLIDAMIQLHEAELALQAAMYVSGDFMRKEKVSDASLALAKAAAALGYRLERI